LTRRLTRKDSTPSCQIPSVGHIVGAGFLSFVGRRHTHWKATSTPMALAPLARLVRIRGVDACRTVAPQKSKRRYVPLKLIFFDKSSGVSNLEGSNRRAITSTPRRKDGLLGQVGWNLDRFQNDFCTAQFPWMRYSRVSFELDSPIDFSMPGPLFTGVSLILRMTSLGTSPIREAMEPRSTETISNPPRWGCPVTPSRGDD
jgi:hypothetical protein